MICSASTKTSYLSCGCIFSSNTLLIAHPKTMYICHYCICHQCSCLYILRVYHPTHLILEGFFFSRKMSLRLIEIQYFCWFLLKLCSTDARMPLFSTKAVSKVLLAKNGTNYTDFELTSSIVYSDIYWICCHTLLIDNSWKAALYIYTKDSMFVYTNHCKRVKLWNIIRVQLLYWGRTPATSRAVVYAYFSCLLSCHSWQMFFVTCFNVVKVMKKVQSEHSNRRHCMALYVLHFLDWIKW